MTEEWLKLWVENIEIKMLNDQVGMVRQWSDSLVMTSERYQNFHLAIGLIPNF